ncbi:GIY-YIG nuclease family protein [Streptomyces sp. NBC_01549]|uniref:GIY-YIG nuclease family protein n=1 Tax=Streptomyces sp. NBC_01549 TaxID=2975874 RepID=UPI00338ED6EE
MTQKVYVIGAVGSTRVKIGRSRNLGKRLAELQRMSPLPLTVLCTYSGGAELESALHRHFQGSRTHGEWFDFGDTDPIVATEAAVSLIERTRPQRPDQNATRMVSYLQVHPALPDLPPERQFQLDPLSRRIKEWPRTRDDVPYFEERPDERASFPRCWCGHQIGTHTPILPHPCGEEFWVQGGGGDACLCLGYEGPLPSALAGYNLPGHNWKLWRAGQASPRPISLDEGP